MIGGRVLMQDRVTVGKEHTFLIPLTDPNGAVISNLSSYTLSADFLKPDGTTEVSITPTLVTATSGDVPLWVGCTLTAANNTAAGQWLLNVYAAAPSANAQDIDRAFVFYVKAEWE